MATDTAAQSPHGEPARCVLVCFTGPLARLPQLLATLKRGGLPIEARRCKTLLHFARELRDGGARLAVIDCGPGNLRVEEAVSVYRRAAGALPLALVGGESAALRSTVQNLAHCRLLEPDDLGGLASQIRAACGMAPQDLPAGDASDGAAQMHKLVACLLHRFADASADLDLRTQEFGADLAAQRLLAFSKQRRRRLLREVASFAVDEEVFLLDAEGEAWFLDRHGGAMWHKGRASG